MVASRTARWWPVVVPGSFGQWPHPLAACCLREADGVAGGDDDVGVMQEPVDGGVGDGLGHELVEPGGMQIRAEGDGAFLVGGVDDSEQRLGGVGGDRQQADVIDYEQIDADQLADRLVDGVVDAVAAQELRERFRCVERDGLSPVDRVVPEGFDQVRLAGPGRVVVALLMLWRFCRSGCG